MTHPLRPDTTVAPALHVDFPAEAGRLAQVRRALSAWLAQAGVHPDQAYDIVLAAGEACTNAVEHGHRGDGGPVRLAVALLGDQVRVVVTDRGRWATPDTSGEHSRGRGMGLMRDLSTEFAVTSSEAGTVVEMLIARG
ncbi:ATP-binding protein [Nocardia lasii]|uniref:ATP-binding protein n=1 Tax=Nocardia lasii TaxID=1616107 RepID=A0ABW1JP50_9NOCA